MKKSSSKVIKKGYAYVKEDGLRSFMWTKRWVLLKEHALSVHKDEVRFIRTIERSSSNTYCPSKQNTYQPLILLFLREIESIKRADNKPHCVCIVTNKGKSHHIAFRNDEDLYTWKDEIYEVDIVELHMTKTDLCNCREHLLERFLVQPISSIECM